MEAYAVVALHHAVRPATQAAARRWAGWTAAAALTLGLAGQVAYHLLAASGRTSAPWAVTVLVSSVPVLALGAAAVLWHLLGRPDDRTPSTPAVQVDVPPPPGWPDAYLWTSPTTGEQQRLHPAGVRAPSTPAVRRVNGHPQPATLAATTVAERPATRPASHPDDPDVATWTAYDQAAADGHPWTWASLGMALGCSAEAARGRARRRTTGGGR